VSGGTDVSVSPRGEGTYLVETRSGEVGTSHTVKVQAGLAAELGWDEASEGELVRESFEFLLEREPSTSILPTFSLDVIGRYFPEYPAEIRRRRAK
jgi:hypothetical protein